MVEVLQIEKTKTIDQSVCGTYEARRRPCLERREDGEEETNTHVKVLRLNLGFRI
jgi:hypothetical protein